MAMLDGDVSFSIIAAVIGTILTAIITQARWSGSTKRVVALAVFAGLTAIGVLIHYYPSQWEAILGFFAITVGVGQVIFTALKPTGIFNWLEDATTPGYQARHSTDPTGPLTAGDDE